MKHLNNSHCGLCSQFDERSKQINEELLIQIQKLQQADESLIAECSHPDNEKLHFKVSPTNGCRGFEPAVEIRH